MFGSKIKLDKALYDRASDAARKVGYSSVDEFVVNLLESVFGKSPVEANALMLQIHRGGSGIAGVYTHEVAETKVAQVTGLAQQHQHPLLCTMEET